MKAGPTTAVALIAPDPDLGAVEALPWLKSARHRPLNPDELRTAGAAVEDAGAHLVSVPLGKGAGWRCFVRIGDCLVSIASAELGDVARAVEACCRLVAECERAAGASAR